MTRQEFLNILVGFAQENDLPIYQFTAHESDKYLVWHIYNQHFLICDNMCLEKVLMVQVDFFHRADEDEVFNDLIDLLSGYDNIAISNVQSDYESDTKYIHDILSLEVVIAK